jgi:hypothetical protein
VVDLSIVIPSIRVQQLMGVYNTLIKAIGKHTFEMIIVGPKKPDDKLLSTNKVKFVEDFGSPLRCGQLGSTYAEGKLFTIFSDDGTFRESNLEQAIDIWYSLNNRKAVMVFRYTEGGSPCQPDIYYVARYHADNRLPGIKDEFYTAPLAIYNLEYFRELGGYDCKFEHFNVSTTDLAIRAQKDGAITRISPNCIADFGCYQNDHGPVIESYHQNDNPYFRQLYSTDSNRIKIPYDNWKEAPTKWLRRFK